MSWDSWGEPAVSSSGNADDMEAFIARNEAILSVDAKLILRGMTAEDKRIVISGGDLPADTVSPVWLITDRLSKKTLSQGSAPPPRQTPPPAKRPKLMEENKWSNQRSRNQRAAEEGRAVYVRGMPPAWTAQELQLFFEDLGEVESVNLLPRKPQQHCLAGFVNFASPEEAMDAARACDRHTVQDADLVNFELACSIKGGLGQKVDVVSGFTELSVARQEQRALYGSEMPQLQEHEIRAIFEEAGPVKSVHLMPGVKTMAAFIIMESKEGAERGLAMDGYFARGQKITISLPKIPRKTRTGNNDSATQNSRVLEIYGFPSDCSIADISGIISASRQPKTVELSSAPDGRIRCNVTMNSVDDATAALEEFNNFEVMPGCVLTVAKVEASTRQQVSAVIDSVESETVISSLKHVRMQAEASGSAPPEPKAPKLNTQAKTRVRRPPPKPSMAPHILAEMQSQW